ncbi:MAG: MarR family transcriptional regulator [Octadecabacter sp.]|nr:MarR family transcriptional regulator [Octadecabacter sp.]
MAICVLTGDIVGSTQLTPAQNERVKKALEGAHSDLTGFIDGTIDLYRGDGWQMSFESHPLPLRFALYIRATLKTADEAFETRIAISEGQATDKSSFSAQLNTSSSEVFVSSGRCLDDMPRDILMAHALGGALHASTVLLDHISRSWTKAQASAIQWFLLPHVAVTQKDVASHLGISRQAVGQALDAAGYHVIDRALRAIEEQAG